MVVALGYVSYQPIQSFLHPVKATEIMGLFFVH